ncbi:unnamed protein product, partial [Mesorhabditis belari]|uniref:cyclic pyranopterin monophosphate synthase n=1 Tax=Mesorhabditis belari TaxID=2138241 RepID=A0AAF3EVS6_9BILA
MFSSKVPTSDSFLSHVDSTGAAHQVDVSEKSLTKRTATALATIKVSRQIFEAIQQNSLKKGDVLSVANIASIQAAKRTADLIPLCHQIPVAQCETQFRLDEAQSCVHIKSSVVTVYGTGVEMEALTAVSIAALTIYDMCKAISHEMSITSIHLQSKSGVASGKMASNSYYRPATTSQSDVPTQSDVRPNKPKATSAEKLTAERLLKFILFNEDRADVHFLFPNETEAVVRLPGHKLILATRSDVFGAQFSGRFADEDECRISDVSSDSFREFLRYLYTDTIEATELGVFAELFYLSEKYMVRTMKDDLIQKLNEIIGKHDVLELLTPPLSNHLAKEAVFKLIDERIDHVLQSRLFLQLPKEVVKDILQRDSLKCNEMTIYSGMIKWAEAECKRNDWPADGEGLRRALDELLHLIRFPTMSGEEFNNGPVGKGLFEGKEAYDLLLCINSLQTKKEIFPFVRTRRKMATAVPATISSLDVPTQLDVVKPPKKAKATSEEKKAPDHPTYAEMVVASISALADRKGSSRMAIANYVLQNYNVGGDSKKVNLHVSVNLKKGTDLGLLQRKEGSNYQEVDGEDGKERLCNSQGQVTKEDHCQVG